jgi:hypothetical protein
MSPRLRGRERRARGSDPRPRRVHRESGVNRGIRPGFARGRSYRAESFPGAGFPPLDPWDRGPYFGILEEAGPA